MNRLFKSKVILMIVIVSNILFFLFVKPNKVVAQDPCCAIVGIGNCGFCYGDMFCCLGTCPPFCDCFLSETEIKKVDGTEKIENLEIGDEVESFNPQISSASSSEVEKIYETTRSAYYKLTLKDGKEIKVTGEHPLYAQPKIPESLSFWEYLKNEGLVVSFLKNFFD